MMTIQERFWPKVDKTDTCWLWTSTTTPNGYGQISRGGRNAGMAYAHRVAYELLVGPIPEGLTIDHLCRVRNCVNPAHLEAVDHRTNVLRSESWTAINARKTECPHGHPYDDTNTVIGTKGERRCRTCVNARTKAWREKRRAAA